jgi:hypothetical protein
MAVLNRIIKPETSTLVPYTGATADLNLGTKNLLANNVIAGYATTATAAGTTTLTSASAAIQDFTGTTTQTVVMPVTSTLALGFPFKIRNLSTRAVTVNSSGGNAIVVLAPSTQAVVTCILTSGTTAASWSYDYSWLNDVGELNAVFLTAAQGAPLLYPDGFYRLEHTLSSADIMAMYATPVAILAAPPANKVYSIIGVKSQSFYTHGGITYTGGGTHFLQFNSTINGAGSQWAISWGATSSQLLATTSIFRTNYGGGSSGNVTPATVAGIGIWASNVTAAYATGNGTLTYRLCYGIQSTI